MIAWIDTNRNSLYINSAVKWKTAIHVRIIILVSVWQGCMHTMSVMCVWEHPCTCACVCRLLLSGCTPRTCVCTNHILGWCKTSMGWAFASQNDFRSYCSIEQCSATTLLIQHRDTCSSSNSLHVLCCCLAWPSRCAWGREGECVWANFK